MPTTAPSGWLRVSQAAEILDLSEQTVRKLIHSGALPASRVGDVEIRISRHDLEDYLHGNPVVGPVPLRDGRRGGRKPGPKPQPRK